MSRRHRWVCLGCAHVIGAVRWTNGVSALQLATPGADFLLIGPTSVSIICPACGAPVVWQSHVKAGQLASTMCSSLAM